MSSLLVIFQSSPHSSAAGQEGLDAVLAAVAMDLNVSLLFVDDGVFHLAQKSHSQQSALRNYTKGFAAVADFGIEKVVADCESLHSRGLSADNLLLDIDLRPQSEISDMIQQHDRVLSF